MEELKKYIEKLDKEIETNLIFLKGYEHSDTTLLPQYHILKVLCDYLIKVRNDLKKIYDEKENEQ